MRRHKRSFIALLALHGLVIVACAGSTSGTSPAAPLASSSTAATAAATTTPAPIVAASPTLAPTPSPTPPPTPMPTAAPGSDLRIDQVVDWMRFEGLKCDGPVGAWPIAVSGTKAIGSGVTLVLAGGGEASLAGSPTAASGTFTINYTIEVKGVPLTTGGQDAKLQGTADFANGELTLRGTVSGTSRGENPYKVVILEMEESLATITLTPTVGSYC